MMNFADALRLKGNKRPVQSGALLAAASEPAALVEDEEQDEKVIIRDSIVQEVKQQPSRGPQAPTVVPKPTVVHRPIARRAVDIPVEDTEAFYRRAHEQQIPFGAVSAAVVDAHEWHRRWTLQEEEGHTHPHDHHRASQQREEGQGVNNWLPDYYAYQELASTMRECGAKNPSPQDKQLSPGAFHEKKRQWGASSSSPSDHASDEGDDRDGSLSSVSHSSEEGPDRRRPLDARRMVKRRVPDPEAEERRQQTHVVTAVQPIRPVPLRIAPPLEAAAAVVPLDSVPRHVLSRMNSSNSDYGSTRSSTSSSRSLSPLTLPSASSSLVRQTEGAGRRPVVHIVEDDSGRGEVPSVISHPSRHNRSSSIQVTTRSPAVLDASVLEARDGLLHALAVAGGDVQSEAFATCLDTLSRHFVQGAYDTRRAGPSVESSEGMWLTLTKPTFFGCLGHNDQGDPLYTMGRMSFDMFSPTSLVCSLQGNFNSVEVVQDRCSGLLDSVPTKLKEEVADGYSVLRTYNIVTAFTIEPPLAAFPEAPNKDARRPVRGIMTTYGYTLPDPETPNRHSVWITGGRIEPNDDPVDRREWMRLFGQHPPKHGLGEKAKLLAVKLLMGATIPESMNEDGSMEYTFTRPLGGHGMAFVDTLYLDETLRIVRGHRGTIFVFSRMRNDATTSTTTQGPNVVADDDRQD